MYLFEERSFILTFVDSGFQSMLAEFRFYTSIADMC
jgi:hypothetical protein